jgi:dolichol-phosphate mannosyltransferase
VSTIDIRPQENNISLVIPAYNEESRIETVIRNYVNGFPAREIIVVCDGCLDGTSKIVINISSKYPSVKCLNFEHNLGKGGAIIEGFKIAQGDIIGFVDADESVEPEDIAKMVKALSENDGVIASRKLKDSKILIKQPFKRRFASKLFNIFVRVIFRLNFNDTQCGAKLFRKSAIQKVLPELKANGFEFDVEPLWRLKQQNLDVIEFPITWKHSEGSKFSLTKSLGMFYSLLKVRFMGN